MAKGNIAARSSAATGVRRENRAIANRPGGWSSGEAKRSHRKSNARSLGRA